MATVQKKREESGLRNTIYEQQTSSGRRLTPARQRLYQATAPIVLGLKDGERASAAVMCSAPMTRSTRHQPNTNRISPRTIGAVAWYSRCLAGVSRRPELVCCS